MWNMQKLHQKQGGRNVRALVLIAVCVGATLLIAAILTAAALPINGTAAAHRHLKALGWDVANEPIEVEVVVIPTQFDDVYARYNELQKQAGFDWEPYKGRRVVRYTFLVEDGQVRANVFCIGKKVIGGDIMTTSLNGLMRPLQKRDES